MRGLANCRAFRRVARLGQQARVERGEIGLGHIDLAAHLEQFGGVIRQRRRNVRDRRDIGGHVLAGRAVAARQCLHQPARLVAQRAGQAVDLRLGGERDGFVPGQLEEAAHAGDELGHLGIVERIVQTGHRPRVADLGEMAGGCGTDLAAGRIGADQVRERRLDRAIAAHQRVIFGVGDLRRVIGVIGAVVVRDLRGERR